jgi:hypothetical protein
MDEKQYTAKLHFNGQNLAVWNRQSFVQIQRH